MPKLSYEDYDFQYSELLHLYKVIEFREKIRKGVDVKLLEENKEYLTLRSFTIFENFINDFIESCAEAIEQSVEIKSFADLPRELINEIISSNVTPNSKVIDYILKKPTAGQITGQLSFHHFTYDISNHTYDKNVKTGKYISYLLRKTGDYFLSFTLLGYNINLNREEQTALSFLSQYSSIHRHKLAHGSREFYKTMDYDEFEENINWFKFIIVKMVEDFKKEYD